MLKRLTALSLALLLALSVSAFAVSGSSFTLTTPKNTTLEFKKSDFIDNYDNGGEEGEALTGVRINTLPSASAGTLKLGGETVAAGQTIPLDAEEPTRNIATLSFEPAEGYTGSATFQWIAVTTTTAASSSATVTITVVEPSSLVAKNMSISTERDWATSDQFDLENPDELAVTFEIVTQPKNGTVTVTDAAKGIFRYRPKDAYVGSDSFTYQAKAEKTTSNTATVSVTVGEPTITPIDYADMKDHWGAFSAGSLAAIDAVMGWTIGDNDYFYPEDRMTRGDFILYLCAVFEIEPSSNTVNPFADYVPSYMVPYVNALRAAGVVDGSIVNGKQVLRAGETLTRIEAIKMIDKALLIPRVERTMSRNSLSFNDLNTVPDWGMQSLVNLVAYDIINGDANNNVNPKKALTRAEGAEMLWKGYKQLVIQSNMTGDVGRNMRSFMK